MLKDLGISCTGREVLMQTPYIICRLYTNSFIQSLFLMYHIYTIIWLINFFIKFKDQFMHKNFSTNTHFFTSFTFFYSVIFSELEDSIKATKIEGEERNWREGRNQRHLDDNFGCLCCTSVFAIAETWERLEAVDDGCDDEQKARSSRGPC